MRALKDMGIDTYIFNKASTSTLPLLQKQAKDCMKCGLAATRRHVVFGEGNSKSTSRLCREAPGEEEDIQEDLL